MTTGPTLHVDEVLIVVEGTARLTWRRTGAARWQPMGLWPTPEQQADVADRLNRGAPLLVVLETTPAIVPLVAEEVAETPDELMWVMEITESFGELHIPFLSWLPPELRTHARRFLDRSEDVYRTPRVLRPSLLLDEFSPEAPAVRFARWLAPGSPPLDELRAVAAHLYPKGTP